MTLWNRLVAIHAFEHIESVYVELFPMEVRFACAEWIEQRMQVEHNYDINNDPNINQRAHDFMRSLIDQLEQAKKRFCKQNQMVMHLRIDRAISIYSTNIMSTSYNTYKHIREVLAFEQHFLENHSFGNNQQLRRGDTEVAEINVTLQTLHTQALKIKEKQSQFTHEWETFKTLEYNESSKVEGIYTTMLETDERRIRSVEEYASNRRDLLEKIHRIATKLISSLQEIIMGIDTVLKVVINRLSRWHRAQALSGNGATVPPNALDEIQMWFCKLADIIIPTRSTIDALGKLEYKMNTGTYYEQITILLQSLIVSGFIVEKQPPQVMKKNTQFAVTVRMLTTNAGIQLHNTPVEASILCEKLAENQKIENSTGLTDSSGDILNHKGNLEMEQSKNHLTCNLRNMQLKKINRTERRGPESVMDEKFALLFKVKLLVADVQINAWVMSLPVVVIVHGIQEPQSWATITWDNGFSEICRQPFQVTDRVSWSRMAEQLSMKFKSKTGRGLTNENLNYLREKALGVVGLGHREDLSITWLQFCKNPLPERSFTFWDWFYAIMKLTRDQLGQAWQGSLINGFISKRDTEDLLRRCAPGTFLLRFSDSEIGGITIAWVDMTPDNVVSVKMFQPFTCKDFVIISLANRIRDLPQCVTLYPDIPKDKAFGDYYTPTELSRNGYVKTKLQVVACDDTVDKTSNPTMLDPFPEPLSVDSVVSNHDQTTVSNTTQPYQSPMSNVSNDGQQNNILADLVNLDIDMLLDFWTMGGNTSLRIRYDPIRIELKGSDKHSHNQQPPAVCYYYDTEADVYQGKVPNI